jgi:hypothetical protein
MRSARFRTVPVRCVFSLFFIPVAALSQSFVARNVPTEPSRAVNARAVDSRTREPLQEIPPLTTGPIFVADGTPVKLQMVRTISSSHAKVGDGLDFVVVKDVTIDGMTVIPSGSMASGSVVSVKKRRMLGMGGKIVIMLDSVVLPGGEHFDLRARREIKGGSSTKLMLVEMLATGISYLPATPVFLFSRGSDSTVLKGLEITAYINGNSQIQATSLSAVRKDASELSEMIRFLPPRTIDGQGHDGDMLNLAFVATQSELEDAFARAGWIKTENTKFPAFWHLAMQRTHYAKLPMRKLYVFGRTQDYSYALPDSRSVVSKRHHLRIWKTDYQQDGAPIWVGAATYDVALQWQLKKLRIFHKIDPKVDAERDFIAGRLSETRLVAHEEYLRCANPVFRGETATGGPYYSDSRMLLLELHSEGLESENSAHARTPSIPAYVAEPAPPVASTLSATR